MWKRRRISFAVASLLALAVCSGSGQEAKEDSPVRAVQEQVEAHMTRIPEARPTPVAAYPQPVAIAASSFALVALTTGVLFASGGAEAQPTLNDVVGFDGSMAIAGTAARRPACDLSDSC